MRLFTLVENQSICYNVSCINIGTWQVLKLRRAFGGLQQLRNVKTESWSYTVLYSSVYISFSNNSLNKDCFIYHIQIVRFYNIWEQKKTGRKVFSWYTNPENVWLISMYVLHLIIYCSCDKHELFTDQAFTSYRSTSINLFHTMNSEHFIWWKLSTGLVWSDYWVCEITPKQWFLLQILRVCLLRDRPCPTGTFPSWVP